MWTVKVILLILIMMWESFDKSSDEATSCDAYSVRNKKNLAGKRRTESKQQQIYDNAGLGEG